MLRVEEDGGGGACCGGNRRLSLSSLPLDCLETLACCLDSTTGLLLYRVNREIYDKLQASATFWKRLCHRENFHESKILLKDDIPGAEDRVSWSGQIFHGGDIPAEAGYWHRVYRRGVQMRRNVARGNFQMWRMFMTDEDSLPVKQMCRDTTFRELRSRHRGCPKADQKRRVRVQRYWNEDYLVVIQHTLSHTFNDIFVWKWEECQNPVFQYSHSLTPLYPTGLFPTAFFLWGKYLVLMPETAGYIPEERSLTSMIRTHDLSENFRLTGQYDFPEDGPRRRLRLGAGNDEAAHLHRLGDNKAVALCRAPGLKLFIFSLPDCSLLQTIPLFGCNPLDVSRSLDLDDLDQRILMKDDTMMFLFHHPDFFNIFEPNHDGPLRYGRLLVVNFEKYLKSGGKVEMKLDNTFDASDDYVEKVCILDSSRLLCVTMSGTISIRTAVYIGEDPREEIVRFQPQLVLPCPEPLKENYEPGLEVDTDGPNLVCSTSGDLIVALRHFVSGRKIHCYTGAGNLLYQIQVDSPSVALEPRPGYLSLDLDGPFLCVADQNKVVIWNNKTGQLVNTLTIPEHYNYRDDPDETGDKFCWKGHTDFAFTEDGIIVIHSQRNFPIAADVFLFW